MLNKTPPVILFILFICIFVSCSRGNSISPILPSKGSEQTGVRRVDVKPVEVEFWNTSVNVDGVNWIAHIDEFGRVTRALGKGINTGEPLDFINSHFELFGVSFMGLIEKRDEVHDGIRCAIYRQAYNGIEVENSLVRIIYGRGGKLVSYGADTWSEYQPSGTWSIDGSAAADLTLSQDDSNLISSQKFYYAKDGALIPSWRVDRDNESFLVDATSGNILETHQNRYEWNHRGHIGGMVKPWSPLDDDIQVDMYGVQAGFYTYDQYYSGSTYTNRLGLYDFFHSKRWRVRNLTFSNPWVNVKQAWESGRTTFDMWE
ncbi:hypothetical protein KKB99_06460, partial [bacterium]|nr:hypothetical protein [bacterium]MBU1025631.1 hypothetical protein [bacterium]